MSKQARLPNPFPGLRPFRSDEHHLFFGREAQTIELLSLLRQHRFLAVVGTSGSGKSSLVQAGLIPALHSGTMALAGSTWEIVVLRPGGRPIENIARALISADLYDRDDPGTLPRLRATLDRSRFGLVEAIKQSEEVAPDTNLLVVVDQFEELFRFRQQGIDSEETSAAFVNLLLAASEQEEQRVYIALTMRSDYLGDCSNIPGLAEAVNRGEYLIPRLLRDQKREAIEMPVGVGGAKIAPRLVQRILNEIGDDPDQLPVLQHALMRTWEVWAGRGEASEAIDFADFDATGGLAEALSRHADEIFHSLPDDAHRLACEKIFKTLTEKGGDNRGIRRPTRLARLEAISGAERTTVTTVLDAFRRPGVTFIMPGMDRELAEQTVVDLSHESLMRCWEQLRGWVEEEAQSARIFRRLLDTARLWRDGKAGLFRDPDLQISLSWREQEQPNADWAEHYGGHLEAAIDFLDQSRKEAEAEEKAHEAARQHELDQVRALAEAQRLRVEEQKKGARRLRKLLAAAAAVAVVAVAASIFAARQTRKAEVSEAAANALAAKLKTTLVQGDWDLSYGRIEAGDGAASLAYLARAMRSDPSYTPAGMRALATLGNGTIPTQRFAPLEHEKPISTVVHNEKHDLLVTSSDGGRDVRAWDFETGVHRASFRAQPVERVIGSEAGPAAPEIVARIKKDFAGAHNIWLAGDPGNPPPAPRFFRKTIEIPKGRVPVKADLFIEVDDSFDLSVNGGVVGIGENWETTYHVGLGAPALANGLELSIVARNAEQSAGFIAAVFLTFAEGEPLVVTSDRSWQSSTTAATGFADSTVLGIRSVTLFEKLLKPALTQLQWSADQDRVLGYATGTHQIVAWDLVTGKPVGKLVEVPAVRNFAVAGLDDLGDLVGCAYSEDGALQVWNATTGQATTPRLKTEGTVSSWAFTRDGRRIVGLFSDSRVGVWETVGGTEVARFDTRPTRAEGIALSPDGKYVVATGEGNRLIWWEMAQGGSSAASWITVPFAFARSVLFHASGDALSVIGGDNDVVRAQTFSLADHKPLADITSDPKARPMGIFGDRSRGSFGIVGAVTGNVVTLWDLKSGGIIQRLAAPELLESANLSPDGRRVIAGSATTGTNTAAGSADKKLFVFDLFSGSVAIPRPIVLAGPCPIAFSPDAETLVTMDGTEQAVRFWDLRTGRQVREPVSASSIRQSIFSRSGKRAALFQYSSMAYGTQSIGQATGRLFLEQVGVPPALPEFLSDRGQSYGWVAAPSDGKNWMLWSRRSGDAGAQLVVRDVHSLAVTRSIDLDVSGASPFYPVVWSRDGGRVSFVKGPKTAVVVDVASGSVLKEFTHDESVAVGALSADGSRAARGFQDGSVKIWSERDGERTIDPFPEKDSIKCLEFNPDGSLLGVGDRTKRTFAILDSRTGEPRITPRAAVNPVDDFAFTPDGRLVVVSAAGSEGKLPMFDLATGELVREFIMRDWSRMLDLSPDGRILAVGSGADLEATSGVAYLFEVATGRLLTPPLSAGGTVMPVAFAPSGAVVATGTYQTRTGFGYAQLWDVATGRALTDPVAGRGIVIALSFLPGGSALAVGWSNGIVNVIPVPPRGEVPGWLPDLAEAVADRRLAANTGVIESGGADRLASLRGRLMAADPTSDAKDPWAPWARWLFEDPQERAVFPGARTTMARHLARLRTGTDIFDLHQAVRWSPSDALTHARLAILYQETAPATLPAPAKAHWNDSAAWFSDRAIALAPKDLEVWSMRGDLMRRLKRPEAAAEATARALALAPSGRAAQSPNALYQNAMALAGDGKWDEAAKAFAGALGLLDEHRRKLDAGEQPLPLLGVLPRLIPTRKLSGTRHSPVGGTGVDGLSPDPIPGAFEDFEGVVDGRLPEGWRVWNRSDHDTRPGVHHLGQFESDLWMDWVVLGREKFEALSATSRAARVLEQEDEPVVEGKAASRLDGRFALALSQGRPGNQVQFLESPDYDCTGQTGVHLSFHSAFEPHDRSMAIIEYSVDRGESWLPIRYLIPQLALDQAKSNTPGGTVDLDTLLDAQRDPLPVWIGKDGRIAGGTLGAFVSARRDLPGLAECVEGRQPTTANATQFKRVELFPLPQAAGKAAVRLRFGLAGSNARYWGIDSVVLHASTGTKPSREPGPEEVSLIRPATDASKLAKAGLEQAFGPPAGSDDYWARVADQIVAAVVPVTAEPASPKPGSPDASTPKVSSSGGNLIEARLLVEQALLDEGRADPLVRASAAAVLLRSKEIDKAWKILTTSKDFARDLAHPAWRSALALAAFERGAAAPAAAAPAESEQTRVLFSMADLLLEGSSGQSQSVRTAIARLEHPDGTGNPADSLLLKRGSEWSYFDEGRLPAADWTQPDFDASRWFRGRAPLGYGGDGEVRVVQFGPDPTKKFMTTYFRTSFDLKDLRAVDSLVLQVRRDDGVVIYLNGTEIARDGVAAGPVEFDTPAAGTIDNQDETRYTTIPVESPPLREGTNWLAAEVHQNNGRSSDLGFDLEVASAAKTNAGLERPAAVSAATLEALGVPTEIRRYLLRKLVEPREGTALSEGLAVVLAAYTEGPASESKTMAAEVLWLRAMAAASSGNTETADRLCAEAIESIFKQVDAAEAFDCRTLPVTLREAALLVRRGPVDRGFLFRRITFLKAPASEGDIVLRWARAAAGTNPAALAEVCHGLVEGKRHQETLALADSVLAADALTPGASPVQIRNHKQWLQLKEAALVGLDRNTDADAVRSKLLAAPARHPALPPKLIVTSLRSTTLASTTAGGGKQTTSTWPRFRKRITRRPPGRPSICAGLFSCGAAPKNSEKLPTPTASAASRSEQKPQGSTSSSARQTPSERMAARWRSAAWSFITLTGPRKHSLSSPR